MVSKASPLPPTAVLDRMMKPGEGGLSAELAAYFEQLDFDPADHARIAVLARGAQDGTLTEAQRREYETYALLDDLLAILRSKARQSLRHADAANGAGEPERHGG